MHERTEEFDTIIPTGRKSKEIVLGYGPTMQEYGSGELCPGGIAQHGWQRLGPTNASSGG